MNFIINNEENFKQMYLYTSKIQGISTIFIDQMPTYLVLKKKCILCWNQNFQPFTMQSDNSEE